MPRNTPQSALRHYIQGLQAVVGCVTESRISVHERSFPQLDTTYPAVLNENNPVTLAGLRPLTFSGGQEFRIVQDSNAANGPNRITTVKYWYQFALLDGRKLLTFHWTPETTSPGQRTYPHLHVESSLLDPSGPFMPDTFSKLHIPTGPVSLAAIVRFAIEELGVTPIPRDWNERLGNVEAAFRQE